MSVDLSKTIAAKSDQLNADDLMGGQTLTINITAVKGHDDPDQPVSIHFEGDNRKPYKPCKSMRRVLVDVWGPQGADYVGKRMTLFRDPAVKFGGIEVGGLRISHMSHIDRARVVPLTVKRGLKATLTVKPLAAERADFPADRGRQQSGADDFPGDRDQGRQQPRQEPTQTASLDDRAKAFERRLGEATNPLKAQNIRAAAAGLFGDLERGDPERGVELQQLYERTLMRLEDEARG